MKFLKNKYWRNLRWFLASVMLFTSAACATGPTLTDHAFSFDAVHESPDIEVLDYQYGNSKQPGARVPEWGLKEERVWGGTNIHGAMLRGDFLYVKWRSKQTGQVYEDTVDLKSRLPADITNHYIHFVIKGSQLYVYLVTPEKIAGRCPTDKRKAYQSQAPGDRIFLMYCSLKIVTIYPDQPKP